MKPALLLRIASALTLFYCLGHGSGFPWTPAVGRGEMAVLTAMKSQHFDVLGTNRTYWDFYYGFGLAITGYLLVQAIVLWQLAALAKNPAVSLRPIIAVFGLGFFVNFVIVWKLFFIIPIVVTAAITIVLGLAFVAAGRRPASARC